MLSKLKKAQSGFTIIELLIVIAIIGILAGLVLTNFQGSQAKARDTQRKARINSIQTKLEEYYANNDGYPDGDLSTAVLIGIDSTVLVDTQGTTIVGSYSTALTQPVPSVSLGAQFAYSAYGCTNASAQSPVRSTCKKYLIKTYLEKDPAGFYEHIGLN